MASNKFIVSDLDFDTIKSNLKAFLQDQPEFSDYNFEGSGFCCTTRHTSIQYTLLRFQC